MVEIEKCGYAVLSKEETQKLLAPIGLNGESNICIKGIEDDKVYVIPVNRDIPIKFVHSSPPDIVISDGSMTISMKDTVKDIIYDSIKNEWYLRTNHIGNVILSEDDAHMLLERLNK